MKRRKIKKEKNGEMKKIEFSKLIMASMIISYFIGLLFGLHIIEELLEKGWDTSSALATLFSYIGAPTAIAVGFYSTKAKAENVAKINKNNGQNFEYIENSVRKDVEEDLS